MKRIFTFVPFPDKTLVVQLYTAVENAPELRQLIHAGELPVDAAFVDADYVPSAFALHISAYKALCDEVEGRLTTRSLHADVVFNLAGSKHIGSSLATFGVSADTVRLLVAKFDATESDWHQLDALVRGTKATWDEEQLGSEAHMRKAYKASDQELSIGGIQAAALCKMAASQC